MRATRAFGRGGFVAAACVACCAPLIVGVLGVTAGLAVTAGVFVGLVAAVVVALLGGGWVVDRVRRTSRREPVAPVSVAITARPDIAATNDVEPPLH
jgi:hypothetical protein